MRTLGVEEWCVKIVQAMYKHARSSVRVNGNFSSEFDVNVGIHHQGSVLSPLLFIIVMDAFSCEFRTGCRWKLLYADDLVIAAESLDELKCKFTTWKGNLSSHGLRVNMGKTKVICSSYTDNRPMKNSDKYPCAICKQGTGSNSIYCGKCKHWVHNKMHYYQRKVERRPNLHLQEMSE